MILLFIFYSRLKIQLRDLTYTFPGPISKFRIKWSLHWFPH